ncbi:hypothetical protein AKJ16_DCAP20012, partial [Drosera capensis]
TGREGGFVFDGAGSGEVRGGGGFRQLRRASGESDPGVCAASGFQASGSTVSGFRQVFRRVSGRLRSGVGSQDSVSHTPPDRAPRLDQQARRLAKKKSKVIPPSRANPTPFTHHSEPVSLDNDVVHGSPLNTTAPEMETSDLQRVEKRPCVVFPLRSYPAPSSGDGVVAMSFGPHPHGGTTENDDGSSYYQPTWRVDS